MAYRVMIAGGRKLSDEMAGMLKAAGHDDIYMAYDAASAVETAGSKHPDVVLMDVELPGGDSVEAVRAILLARPVPVIMHASYSQVEKVQEAVETGVSAHLFRPVTAETLLATLELGMSRFRQCQVLHAEISDCRETLRIRKLVERAKGIMMKRNRMTEEEAFLKIQAMSRNNNIPMEKVAESIITANELL
ncbi:MAG: ANTAR domain-containing protein [Nitrospirae bacterium]|nr:ANTAR domain-containing protein [Nitrospirota bacterium]